MGKNIEITGVFTGPIGRINGRPFEQLGNVAISLERHRDQIARVAEGIAAGIERFKYAAAEIERRNEAIRRVLACSPIFLSRREIHRHAKSSVQRDLLSRMQEMVGHDEELYP